MNLDSATAEVTFRVLIGRSALPHLAATTLLLVALLPAQPALAEPGEITLVSASDAGVKANYGGTDAAISGDGTKVAFRSHATNLDPKDADYYSSDIYVKDLRTGDITLASTSDTGDRAWGSSFGPTLSADGTRVAFSTAAPNLDPADPDWDSSDIYVKDLRTGDIMLASASDAGVKGDGESFSPTLSADGNRVSFASVATNLDPGDQDTVQDIYVKDLRTGDVILASTSDGGTKATDSSFEPVLSADGNNVAFHSAATNLDPADTDATEDIYVKDLRTGEIVLASTSDDGIKGNGASVNSSVSADGLIVAFQSASSNLDPGDLDFDFDVYVKNLTTGELVVASTTHTGGPSGGTCSDPSLSGDGTKVAFRSSAYLHPDDTGLGPKIFVRDLAAGTIRLASSSDTGERGNSSSILPSISADGTKVAFESWSTNFDERDRDHWSDIYMKGELPERAAVNQTLFPVSPGDAPSGSLMPTPKHVRLRVSDRQVQEGDRVTVSVRVSPCGNHTGERVVLEGGGRQRQKRLNEFCGARWRLQLVRTTTFRAISPQQDADHLTGVSRRVKVTVV